MANWTSSNWSNVDEYGASGTPYVTSSQANEVGAAPIVITFPTVTRWVQVFNTDGSGNQSLRVGFSENGVNSNPDANYIVVEGGSNTGRLEARCLKLFIRSDSGTSSFSVAAGLTQIPKNRMFLLSGSNNIEGVG